MISHEQFWSQMQRDPVQDPSPSLRLIRDTVCEGAVYREGSHSFPHSLAALGLSASQQIAVGLASAPAPVMVIQGVAGSGKSRIARILAQSAMGQGERILLLSGSSPHEYEGLPGIVTHLDALFSDGHDALEGLQHQLHKHFLGGMQFLPLYFLEDFLLNQLRTPQQLEYWIPQLHLSISELTQALQSHFPDVGIPRLQVLAYRLKTLTPLLQTQLGLSQQAQQLSPIDIQDLARQILSHEQITLSGKLQDYLSLTQDQRLLLNRFDCTIITEAEQLGWREMIELASKTEKLILLGTLPSRLPNRDNVAPENPFHWLGEYLFPTYRYRLVEQFRIHRNLSVPIFKALYNTWIQPSATQPSLQLTSLPNQLVWKHVPGKPGEIMNPWEGKQVLGSLLSIGSVLAHKTGIMVINLKQKKWIKDNLPPNFSSVKVGIPDDWRGESRAIMLIMLGRNPRNISHSEMELALTRANDYLILFGNKEKWSRGNNPIAYLLADNVMSQEREVVFQ